MKQVLLSTTTEFKEISAQDTGTFDWQLDQPCQPFPSIVNHYEIVASALSDDCLTLY